jgi:8-oxo-dGTP pyrophosphatase MutT (NUDIX family)
MTCLAVPTHWTASFDFPGAHGIYSTLHEVREALESLLGDAWPVPAEPRSVWYTAAGGVVVHDGRVLVLCRPSRDEVRLPKGHVDPGEEPQGTAVREVCEESGYPDLVVKADLGVQRVEFVHQERHVTRTERYFLMVLSNGPDSSVKRERQFEPEWLTWDEALAALTFEAEREWVRRARKRINEHKMME